MSNHSEKLSLSRTHHIWVSPVIGMLFTYAGVEEPFLEVITHLDFIINFILNSLEVFVLMYLIYWLYFNKNRRLWLAILISLGVFYLIEFTSLVLFDYNAAEETEFFSLTLPFGSAVIIAFNFFYHLKKQQTEVRVSVEEIEEPLWLDSISGRVKINESRISYAFLTETYLEINTEEMAYKTFYSLKQLEDLLTKKKEFFRLNKQYLSHQNAILSYKSLSDGRLEISLPNDKTCIVSKNKASSFKRWLDE